MTPDDEWQPASEIARIINDRATALVLERETLRKRLTQIEAEIRDCVAAGRLFGVTLDLPDVRNLSVSAAVLDCIQQAAPHSIRASEIRRRVGGHHHEKTIGMSLNRHRRAGRVQRNGWDWSLATASVTDPTPTPEPV